MDMDQLRTLARSEPDAADALAEIESLRQQLDAANQDNEALSFNSQGTIAKLRQQLAESQALVKVLRDALGEYVNVCQSGYDPTNWNVQVVDAGNPARDALAMPSDSTALDSAIRQAKREGYVAGFMASGEGWNGEYPFQDKGMNPLDDEDFVERMAEELK